MKQELQTVRDEIETIMELVHETTGTYKYDSCYEDCLMVVDKHIKNADKKTKDLADRLSGYMGWPAKEILKLILLRENNLL